MSNPRKKYSKRSLMKAIRSSPGGIISAIAVKTNLDWHTVRNAIDRDPELLQAWQDERERLLDAAESALAKSIGSGDTQDAKWLLARLGKTRGWGDNVDVTGRGKLDVELRVIYGDDGSGCTSAETARETGSSKTESG